MKLYGAIDLHSNNNVTVLIDEQNQVAYQKRLANDLPTCELPVHFDMFLQNGDAALFLRAHDRARLDKRFDEVFYGLRILLNKSLRAHEGLDGRAILLKSNNTLTPSPCSRADGNLSNAAPSIMPVAKDWAITVLSPIA